MCNTNLLPGRVPGVLEWSKTLPELEEEEAGILKRHDIVTAVAASERRLFQSDYVFKPWMIGLVTWAVEFSSSGHVTRWLSFDRKENKHFLQRFFGWGCAFGPNHLWESSFDGSEQNEPLHVARRPIYLNASLLAPFFFLLPTSLPSHGTLWEAIMTVLLKSQSPYSAF